MIDIDKLNYHSAYPIDKVVASGTVSIINDGATSSSQQARIVTETIENPYGKAVFARGIFSVAGGDYNSIQSHLLYTFSYTTPGPSTATLAGLKAAVSIGVSDSSIYIRTANGFHGAVNDDGVTITYTPTSLIFLVRYVLYEKE